MCFDLISGFRIFQVFIPVYKLIHLFLIYRGNLCSQVWRNIPFKIQSGYFPNRKINFRVGNQLTPRFSLLSARWCDDQRLGTKIRQLKANRHTQPVYNLDQKYACADVQLVDKTHFECYTGTVRKTLWIDFRN